MKPASKAPIMISAFCVHLSGPDRSGYVTHTPTATAGNQPRGPHLSGLKRNARTWDSRAAAERYVACLNLRLTDDPRPGETVASVQKI